MHRTTDEILRGWEEYFTDLYSPSSDAHFDAEFKSTIDAKLVAYEMSNKINQDHSCKKMSKEIEINEVISACKELKKNVAGGKDQLVYEHLIYGGLDLSRHISWLFTLMLFNVAVPPTMKNGIVITILKHGKKE